jgi:hypothetical protein
MPVTGRDSAACDTSSLEKKQNIVRSTYFKDAWFYTSTPLSFKLDSSFSMVNTLPTLSISLPAFYSQGFLPHLLTRNELYNRTTGPRKEDKHGVKG